GGSWVRPFRLAARLGSGARRGSGVVRPVEVYADTGGRRRQRAAGGCVAALQTSARGGRAGGAQADVDDGVEEVDGEVDDDIAEGGDHDHGQQDRIVPVGHGLSGDQPDAVAAAHRFGDHGTGDELTEDQSDDRQPRRPAVGAAVGTSSQSAGAALAVVAMTKPEAWTSVEGRMRTWAIGADRGPATVRVGSTSASAGPGETTETSPSWKEKAWMSRIPSQKTGTEMKRLGT